MGCCSRGSDNQVMELKEGEYGPTSSRRPQFEGPLAKRSCTDTPMLLFFILFMAGMGYIGYIGYMTGDPYRVLYGIDSWGNTCNKNNTVIPNANFSGEDTTGLEYRYYFTPAALTNPVLSSVVLCTKACPEVALSNDAELEAFHSQSGASLCRYDVDPQAVAAAPAGTCPSFTIGATIPLLSFCIPQSAMSLGQTMFDTASGMTDEIVNSVGVIHAQCTNSRGFFQNFVSDINTTWREISYLCAISVGVAFLFTLMMRFFAAVFIWMSVIFSALAALGGAAFCWYTWYTYTTSLAAIPLADQMASDQETVQQWFYFGVASTAVAVIVLLVLLVMRKRILLVVQLFKEAGKAIAMMPLLLVQPLWTLIAVVIFVGGLLVVFSFIFTAGAPVIQDDGYVEYESDEMLFYLKWYYLLGMLWVIEFVFACQQLIIAGSVATWYFSRDKVLGCPIASATKRLILYHLGSVAFGSLLVAIVQLCRIILGYIQKKLHGRSSKAIDFLLKCLQCCLWCFEKLLKFINKNAYIMIAIYGTNFCNSAKKALQVIIGNVLRVGAINSVGAFCLLLGKMGVSAITMAIGLYFFKGRHELCYMFVPLLVSGAFAFAIGHCFLSVYAMAIDTIFMCFCEDCERNDGVNAPYFMSKDLMKYVDNSREAMGALDARDKASNVNNNKGKQVSW